MHTASTLIALTGAAVVLAGPAPAPAVPLPVPIITPGAIVAFPAGRAVAPRQLATADSDAKETACLSQYLSLADTLPTPAPKLLSWLESAAPSLEITVGAMTDDSLTSLCESARITPPPSLSSAYSSFESAGSSWVSKKSSEVASIQKDCGGEVSAMLGLLLMTDEETCTSAMLGLVDVAQSALASATRSDGGEPQPTESESEPSATTAAPQPSFGAGGDGEDNGGAGSTGAPAPSSSSSTGGVPAARETGLVAAVAAVVGVAGIVAAL